MIEYPEYLANHQCILFLFLRAQPRANRDVAISNIVDDRQQRLESRLLASEPSADVANSDAECLACKSDRAFGPRSQAADCRFAGKLSNVFMIASLLCTRHFLTLSSIFTLTPRHHAVLLIQRFDLMTGLHCSTPADISPVRSAGISCAIRNAFASAIMRVNIAKATLLNNRVVRIVHPLLMRSRFN